MSWEHFFITLHRYYSNLRQETMMSSDTQHIYRHRPPTKGITPDEMEGLIAVLELIKVVSEQVCNFFSFNFSPISFHINLSIHVIVYLG